MKVLALPGQSQIPRTIVLPAPADDSAISVFSALKLRRTTRDFSTRALSPQLLSNLLWAACGVNRPSGPFGSAREDGCLGQ